MGAMFKVNLQHARFFTSIFAYLPEITIILCGSNLYFSPSKPESHPVPQTWYQGPCPYKVYFAIMMKQLSHLLIEKLTTTWLFIFTGHIFF